MEFTLNGTSPFENVLLTFLRRVYMHYIDAKCGLLQRAGVTARRDITYYIIHVLTLKRFYYSVMSNSSIRRQFETPKTPELRQFIIIYHLYPRTQKIANIICRIFWSSRYLDPASKVTIKSALGMLDGEWRAVTG